MGDCPFLLSEKCASTDTVHDIVRSVPGLYTVPVSGDEAGGGCSDDNSGALCMAFPTVFCQVRYIVMKGIEKTKSRTLYKGLILEVFVDEWACL